MTCMSGSSRRDSRRSPPTCSCTRRDDCHAIRLDLERFLEERFHVEHTTLQVDHAPEEFLRVERLVPDPRTRPARARQWSWAQASAALAAQSAQTPSTAK